MNKISLLLALVLGATAGCSSVREKSNQFAYEPRPAIKGVTAVEAKHRRAMVSRVDYELSMHLGALKPEFTGIAKIDLELRHVDHPLTLDFVEGTIADVIVNGRAVEVVYNGLFLTLPKEALRTGENRLQVAFSHRYENKGVGLHRFKDPEDGRSYVYTDFEPYDANKMFPCLDQPDLKATYKLTVEAPADWTVISAVRERSVTMASDGAGEKTRVWSFDRTPRFSTYIFSLHAGPYQMWSSKAGKIPLRLFARRSLAKYVPAEQWFKATRQGFSFFEKYFAVPYPFKKYDQVIVPEFNSGAMENVAAVTFSEIYVHRAAMTEEQKESRANVILHEMAHMWFGDLVTMRWWNGLWLNESFATYMASLALVEATEFKRAWETFFKRKQSAYREDQLVTTHPIEVPVDDTDTAFNNFDGITYGKGAAVLKQLAHFLGEVKFRNGVRNYLKTHAYGNAELSDFFGALEKASGTSLEQWNKQWLNTASLNTVEAVYSCGPDQKINAFRLVQTAPPEYPTIRSHRTRVVLYGKSQKGPLNQLANVSVAYQGSSTEVPSLYRKACPALVYANHEDFDFVKVKFDHRSLETVRGHLNELEDPLLRAMLWHSLWEMVRDSQLSVTDYAEIVLAMLPGEREVKVALGVAATLQGVLHYLPLGEEPGAELGERYSRRFEDLLWKSLISAKPGTDFQKLWFDHVVGSARTPERLEKLADILSGKLSFKGMIVDQDRRWEIVARLNEFNYPGAVEATRAELARDPSDKGERMAITAEAIRPESAIKRKWIATLADASKNVPLARLRRAMSMFPRSQRRFRAEYAAETFDVLARGQSRDNNFLQAFAISMAPALCTNESVAALKRFIEQKTLPASALKMLKIVHQEDERCVRVRELGTSR